MARTSFPGEAEREAAASNGSYLWYGDDVMTPRLPLLLLLALTPLAAADWVDLLPPATPLGQNIPGWTRIPIPATSGLKADPQWIVDGGNKTIVCTGKGGHEWLRYDKELGDYVLQVEWKFAPKDGETRYNSGIGIRLSGMGELWFQAQTGLAGGWLFGTNFADGALKRVNLRDQMKENRVKPAGEWNLYEIRVQGDRITLSINGGVVSEVTGVGLRRGYIGLEAEGYEIAFRNLKLQPLN